LVGVTLIVATWVGGIVFMLLFLAILVIAHIELFALIQHLGFRPQKKTAVVIGASIFIMNYLHAKGILTSKIHLIYIPFVLTILISELYRKGQTPFITAGVTLLGIIYLAFPFSLLNYLVYGGYESPVFMPELLLTIFVFLWANDVGAYAVGSLIGKRPLFKRVSPNKSWEGTIGGLVCVQLAAWGIGYYVTEILWFDWLIMGALVSIFGSYGDLLESLFKRSVQVKDSGSILPGHGGILDRFDSLLLSAPVIFTYLQLRSYAFMN
jgi:phosphatidate cytidylyltransferase